MMLSKKRCALLELGSLARKAGLVEKPSPLHYSLLTSALPWHGFTLQGSVLNNLYA